jgi:endoglucanase
MTSNNLKPLTVLIGFGFVTALVVAACSTGSDKYCNGRPATDCSTIGGSNTDTGGTSNAGGAGTGGSKAGATAVGGMISTSSTVLRIVGNSLRDVSNETGVVNPAQGGSDAGTDSGIVEEGIPVILRGVNRSGTEYKCAQGNGIFDGPDTEASIQAIKQWNVNTVRVPLNETCWLAPPADDAPGLRPQYSGVNYKMAIQNYVARLHKYDIYPILELHWVAKYGQLALSQLPMPDADHAEAFWKDVALTFKDDLGVIFELYNEPYPDGNRDSDAAWTCWRDGCKSDVWGQVANPDGGTTWQIIDSYQTVGFQKLVDAVRGVEGTNSAASHVILLGGVQYSNALSQWSKYKPQDSANNLGAAWHIYNFNSCAGTGCFGGVPLTLSQSNYVLPTEIGENDCKGSIVSTWMDWFDSHGFGYLAWSWNVNGAECIAPKDGASGNPWSLIKDFTSGAPMGDPGSYGQTIHDHLISLKP